MLLKPRTALCIRMRTGPPTWALSRRSKKSYLDVSPLWEDKAAFKALCRDMKMETGEPVSVPRSDLACLWLCRDSISPAIGSTGAAWEGT